VKSQQGVATFHESSEGGFNPLVKSEYTGELELESRIKTFPLLLKFGD
jgi:hypothetical protein